MKPPGMELAGTFRADLDELKPASRGALEVVGPLMRDRRDEGLWTWRQKENNNRMIALQRRGPLPAGAAVDLAYFGGSAFRITSPAGLSVMIDPWRNPPWGNWDWYLYDFPSVEVDIGVSTHAHFDHDGLHALRANMLLDRPVGTFTFADVTITGIADKLRQARAAVRPRGRLRRSREAASSRRTAAGLRTMVALRDRPARLAAMTARA